MIPTVVLTAGLGTRLMPLTRYLAKPAVPVAGRPLVVRVLEWLRGEGISDAVLNLHHLPETVTGAVGDGHHLGLTVRYSWEPRILGSAGGPKLAFSLWPGLDGLVLIVNGDTLTDFRLAPMIAAHKTAGAKVTMAVVRNERPDHYNGLRLSPDGDVLTFVPKGHTEETWHFIGVHVVEPDALEGVPLGEQAETVAGLYRTLVQERPGTVRAWRVEADFLDIGTPADYVRASLQLARAERGLTENVIESPWSSGQRPAEIDGSAHVRNSVIWPGATVERHAQLDGCVVLQDARVAAGTIATGQVFEKVGK